LFKFGRLAHGIPHSGVFTTLDVARFFHVPGKVKKSPAELANRSLLHGNLMGYRVRIARNLTGADMAEHDFPQLEIPAQVAAALSGWVQQAAHEVGSPLRAEIEDLRAQLAEARATLEENEDQITRLNGEVRNFRTIAADALVGKAKDQLAIEGKDAQIADLRDQLERSVAVAATLSDAKLAAEMELVGAATARDNYLAEAQDLRSQLEACRAARRG
jgi:hypothetical protein